MSSSINLKRWLWILLGVLGGTLVGLGILAFVGVIDIRSWLPGSAQGPAGRGLSNVGIPAPVFKLQDLSHRQVELSDYRGKVVVINFWATWCNPCRDEMPVFEGVFQEKRSDLAILGINLEESPGKIQDFIEAVGASYPILLDSNGEVARLYQVLQLPTTFFIDREGTIQVRHIGTLSAEQFDKYLAQVGVDE